MRDKLRRLFPYLIWAETACYEKKRLFQFQALSAIGSMALGIAALWFTFQQHKLDLRQRDEVQKEKRAEEIRETIRQASVSMTSILPRE